MSNSPTRPNHEDILKLANAIRSGKRGLTELKSEGFTSDFLEKYRMVVMRRIQRGEI